MMVVSWARLLNAATHVEDHFTASRSSYVKSVPAKLVFFTELAILRTLLNAGRYRYWRSPGRERKAMPLWSAGAVNRTRRLSRPFCSIIISRVLREPSLSTNTSWTV